MQLPAHYHQHHLLMLHQPAAPVTTRRQRGSRVDEAVFSLGDVGLYPEGEYGTVAWNGPTDTIHLYLDDQHLENLARQSLDLTRFALADHFRFQDPLLDQVGRQLLGAVGAQHDLGRLYVESLTTALSYHLIRHHATYERRVVTREHTPPGPGAGAHRRYLEAHADGPSRWKRWPGWPT
ncbi:MAG: hypothetical protein WKG07_18085 [Hymenobacter sp.]